MDHDGTLDLIIDNHDQGVIIGFNDQAVLGDLRIASEAETISWGFLSCRGGSAGCTGDSGDFGAVADLSTFCF